MEIREVSGLASGAQSLGEGATVTPLYPSTAWGQGLVAVDIWEIAPGGTLSNHSHPEEHVLYVLSGQGRLMGGGPEGTVAAVRENTVIYLAPKEAHQVRNTGNAPLRILVSTPMLVRSERASGVTPARHNTEVVNEPAPHPEAPPVEAQTPVVERPRRAESVPEQPILTEAKVEKPVDAAVPSEESQQAQANIAGMMRKASELKDQPRPQPRKPVQPPEPEEPQQEEPQPQPEEDEEQSNLMELFVAFDGGIRGSTAQGFGRYLVQSPGRKPVVKVAEFADNYTPAQAQYEALIEALRYIVARLEATGRTAEQVQLDIRSGKKKWSFIDGPITANNPMGVHHAWGRTYKDIYQRYHAMLGYDQRYQNGYDCHGLWVEVEVEKEMGFNSKREILKYGLEEFVLACRRRVMKYAELIAEQSARLGQWMDWDDSYFTMSDNNSAHIWHFLKQCHDNGWLYRGTRSLAGWRGWGASRSLR